MQHLVRVGIGRKVEYFQNSYSKTVKKKELLIVLLYWDNSLYF